MSKKKKINHKKGAAVKDKLVFEFRMNSKSKVVLSFPMSLLGGFPHVKRISRPHLPSLKKRELFKVYMDREAVSR